MQQEKEKIEMRGNVAPTQQQFKTVNEKTTKFLES